VVISLARLEDGYYSTRAANVSLLALGNWKRKMSPPSIFEFVLTLVLREGIAAVAPSLRGSVHLGTKGCILDFTANLDEVKHKVLGAFVCSHCRAALLADGQPALIAEIPTVLEKKWLGKESDPESPAATITKLGHNLFSTKGLKTTAWEKIVY